MLKLISEFEFCTHAKTEDSFTKVNIRNPLESIYVGCNTFVSEDQRDGIAAARDLFLKEIGLAAKYQGSRNMSVKRIVVLTGATRGLGRAMLDELIAAGHAVAGCGRDTNHIEELCRMYPAAHNFSIVDVSDDIQVADWAVRVINTIGTPDLLINNAALVNANAPLWEVDALTFDAVTSVNINGVANVIRHFVPSMIAAGRGVIVNFSSGWGRVTSAGVAPYCASKWAIEGLTKALAQDLPSGMAAIPLNPGIIDTDMLRVSFGREAGGYPSPEQWVSRAVKMILAFGPKDSGKSLSID